MNQNPIVLERIILLTSSLIALYFAVKEERKFPKLITTVFAFCFAITITDISYLIQTGFLLMTFSSFLVILYAVVEKQLTLLEKMIISLTGLIIFIGNLFAIQHWSYGNPIKIISILPLITFCLLLYSSQYKSKSGLFITLVLVIAGIFRFITLWEWQTTTR